uniref:E-beta-farnesene synthase n=1 Tax=Tanacetum cinerariifolium TaxID=118510 RepID=A0A6L2P5N3_TANCI|nr:E-beta-farnesene synthase [Tanacetum cinerariifolium]
MRKHKFHPRLDSSLHLPNEEPVLGYLKFSAKETKLEVFGMPIPGNLITANIQGEPYYQEYLEKVAKHQRYLASEQGSDPDSPALMPAKTTKKSKASAPKADPRPPVTKPASSQQPEPKPTTAKSKGKKRKLVTKTFDMPSLTRKSRPVLVTKRRKATSPLWLVDESVAEGIPKKEPRFDNEEADVHWEPESGKYLPLPFDPPKGTLVPRVQLTGADETPKKKSLVAQFIFQRRTSTPTRSYGHDESLSLYVELGLTDSEVESDEDVPGIDAGVQGEGQAGPNPGEQDEGQARPNLDELDKGQAGPNPVDAAASQPQLSLVVHVGPNLEHIDLEATDVSTQPHPEQMDEGFIATTYQKRLTRCKHEKDSSPRMWETNSYKTHEDHMMLYEALEKSMNRNHSEVFLKDLAEAHKKKKIRLSGTSGSPGASGSSQILPPSPPPPSTNQEDLQMDDDMALDAKVRSSDDEDIKNAHIPKVNLRHDWWKPLEEDRPATPEPAWSIPSSDMTTGDMAMFMDWFCKRQGITELKPQDLEGPVFELVKVFHPNVIHLHYQMEECHKLLTDSIDDLIIKHNVSKPLPLGGPPGQVTIQSDFFFNKDLEYLRYGSKGSRPALSISKMKADYYPDIGLEQMVPDQMWIDEECKYDIAAMSGISHWWFQRLRFYIDRNISEGDRRAVRTHMWILSVVKIEVFSMYGYDYMKKIVLRRTDLNEHIITERDFKYLYPSDFEDLYLLNFQGHLNHLPPKDKKILTTAVNLWTRHLHDYTVIDSLRAVTFQDRYGVQMVMRFNEIHKFSDGTLHQIDEALDYRVKEFNVNRMNSGLNIRLYTCITDYSPASDTESDPSKDLSSDHIPPLPATSSFLSSTDDSSDNDIPDTPPSPTHDTPLTETTLSTQISPAASGLFRRRVMVLVPRQPIPHGRPYRYHLNGLVHTMTTRKRVGPDSSPSSSLETSSDSPSDDVFDPSSYHSLPTPSSGRQSHDSSSASPSHNRSRSPAASVSLSLPISRSLSYARANLLPSPKRVKSSEFATNLEDSLAERFDPSRSRGTELEMDVDVVRSNRIDIDLEIQLEIDECIAYVDALRARGINDRVVVEDEEGAVEVTYETLGDLVQRFHGHTVEILVHHVQAIDELERVNMRLRDMMDVASQRVTRSQRRELRVQRELRQIWRFRFYDRIRIARLEAYARRHLVLPFLDYFLTTMTREAVNKQIDRRLPGALGAREAARNLEPLMEMKEMEMEKIEMKEMVIEEVEIKEMKIKKMEMVMGTKEEMAINLEDLYLLKSAHIKTS